MEEDSYIVSNFHSICRLCLRKNGVMSSLFEYVFEDSEVPLYERISELAELQILPNDGLPGRICHRCLYKTEKCVKFRSRCLASAAKLRRLTRQGPAEVLVVDPGLDSPSSEPEEPERPEEPASPAASPPASPPSSVFMCQYCDRAYTERARCREHERAEHDESAPYGCGACGLVFAERAGQAAHARDVHACARPYPCGQCARAFSRRSDLRKHAVVHTGARPFRCRHCGKAFSRNTNLSKHLRIHAGHRPHVCPACPRSFVSKGDLARHALVHSGARPFPCQHCPLAFGRRDKLAKHEAHHARILQGDNRSSHPSQGDFMLPSIPDHMTGESFFDASQLLKEEARQAHLLKQEDMVVNVDPYKGEDDDDLEDNDGFLPSIPDHISGEGFFDASQLLKEEPESNEDEEDELEEDEVPNGESTELTVKKPPIPSPLVQCRNCPLKFSSIVAFNKHSVIHDGAKDFRCKICSKSFARKRELDRHAVVHTGYKPFECTRCDKKFGRKDKLVRHERIHDERKEFSCFECAASFTRKDSLMSHLKTHFPDLLRDNSLNSDEEDDEMLSKDG